MTALMWSLLGFMWAMAAGSYVVDARPWLCGFNVGLAVSLSLDALVRVIR